MNDTGGKLYSDGDRHVHKSNNFLLIQLKGSLIVGTKVVSILRFCERANDSKTIPSGIVL